MTDADDTRDLQAMRERVAAARAGLASIPLASERAVGPADPDTGESWHRGNVLGHMSEMLDYWTSQFARAVEVRHHGPRRGRHRQRRKGIDRVMRRLRRS